MKDADDVHVYARDDAQKTKLKAMLMHPETPSHLLWKWVTMYSWKRSNVDN